MNGADYVAQVELYDKERDELVAVPGETCERVNPTSLGWLAEQRLIVHQTEAPAEPVSPTQVMDSQSDTTPLEDEEA
jgi:hypothetical protein